MRNLRFHFVFRALLIALPILFLPTPLEARDQNYVGGFVQSDGTVFGDGGVGDYWGGVRSIIAKSLCEPVQFARWLAIGIGLVLSMWLAYKATRGHSQAWKPIVVIIIVLGILANPIPFFEKVTGFNVIYANATAWSGNMCGGGWNNP